MQPVSEICHLFNQQLSVSAVVSWRVLFIEQLLEDKFYCLLQVGEISYNSFTILIAEINASNSQCAEIKVHVCVTE